MGVKGRETDREGGREIGQMGRGREREREEGERGKREDREREGDGERGARE